MHSPVRALVALALTGAALPAANAQQSSLVRDGVAVTDSRIARELPGYLQARAMPFVDWLADGSLLVVNASQRPSQIERVRAELGAPEQVSFAPATVITAVARPYTSDAFAYVESTDPSAAAPRAELYLQQIGAAARAIGAILLDRGAPAWAHDGRHIAFVSADSAVYVLDTGDDKGQARLVTSGGDARWHVLGWSLDDQTLLLGRERGGEPGASLSASDATAESSPSPPLLEPHAAADTQLELYLAKVEDGTVLPVPAFGARGQQARRPRSAAAATATPAALASAARFASDGHAVLLATRQPCQGRDASDAHEFVHLCLTDPTDGDWRQLSASVARDVELFDESADGSLLVYSLNDEGTSRLVVLDLRLRTETPVAALAALGPGVIETLKFDPTGRHLALTFESARSTPDAYVLDAQTGTISRWTRSDAGLPESAGFVAPQILHFPTWDGVDGQPRQLSALLYRPSAGAAVAAPASPVLIWLCSGGRQQCRPRYEPFVQYLVQRLGFVVIAPNVRGSSGYGTGFEAAGAGPLQDDAARDVGSLLVWIGLQPGLDRGRVALLGEGFGSYLALSSLAQFGDRLSGAVAAFPRRLWSLPNALAIRRPVLLVQGLADPQVPPYQAAQLREGLRASGVPVQYLAAADERGRFVSAESSAAYYEAAATFLERLLR